MSVHNSEIADLFEELADLLEIEGANAFRVRAYRNAARVVGGYSKSMADLVNAEEDLSELPGIGEDLAGKIKTIVETGSLPLLEEVKERTPVALSQLTRIEGLGPKRVKALYKELGVQSLDDLRAAAEAGKIHELEGFGEKTEEHILQELDHLSETEQRIGLMQAEEVAEPLVGYLKKVLGVKQITVAGSYRRRKETVGDLDILVTCKKDSPVMDRFVGYEEVSQVVSHGATRSTVQLRSGLQVDLRVLPQVSYGAALNYFTGSKAHNIRIRKLGVERNLKINEYGVYQDDKRIAGRTEEEVYAEVGLPFIPPELREDRGEIEAAQQGELPELITLSDIRGDLHMHTKATDGHDNIEDLARAGKAHGYEYIAITDHSKRVSMAKGLTEKRLAQQIDDIDRFNDDDNHITVLKGIEVDILEDGSLDLPNRILERLDVTVCSVHYGLDMPGKRQTDRIIKAMDNPCFNILGHPTGRLINERAAYEVEMERLLRAAKERGCIMEVNSQPSRLDLPDVFCILAKETGVKLAVSTDAHSAANLDYIRFGIDQARRGWLSAENVINTRNLKGLRELLARD